MDFNEFLKDKKIFDKALKCKDIDEFKKLVDECKVKYDKPEELDKAWSYVKKNASSEDGSLDDEALGSVAGGLSIIDVGVPEVDVLRDFRKRERERSAGNKGNDAPGHVEL